MCWMWLIFIKVWKMYMIVHILCIVMQNHTGQFCCNINLNININILLKTRLHFFKCVESGRYAFSFLWILLIGANSKKTGNGFPVPILQTSTKEGNDQEIPLREERVVCFVCRYLLAELGWERKEAIYFMVSLKPMTSDL